MAPPKAGRGTDCLRHVAPPQAALQNRGQYARLRWAANQQNAPEVDPNLVGFHFAAAFLATFAMWACRRVCASSAETVLPIGSAITWS